VLPLPGVRRSALEDRGRRAVYDAHGAVTQAQYHFVWPSFSINPGQPNLSVDVWLPDGPERTRGFTERFFGSSVPEDYQHELIAFNKQVSGEDDRLTSSVQRGLRAGLPAQGRFLAKSEHLVGHFQKLVLEALGP
jgi:phenylpropionate dioxygenase-like ring-hydroxylating dioxygenase large terminal subunit